MVLFGSAQHCEGDQKLLFFEIVLLFKDFGLKFQYVVALDHINKQ